MAPVTDTRSGHSQAWGMSNGHGPAVDVPAIPGRFRPGAEGALSLRTCLTRAERGRPVPVCRGNLHNMWWSMNVRQYWRIRSQTRS